MLLQQTAENLNNEQCKLSLRENVFIALKLHECFERAELAFDHIQLSFSGKLSWYEDTKFCNGYKLWMNVMGRK